MEEKSGTLHEDLTRNMVAGDIKSRIKGLSFIMCHVFTAYDALPQKVV
jgi:hypothetical protein